MNAPRNIIPYTITGVLGCVVAVISVSLVLLSLTVDRQQIRELNRPISKQYDPNKYPPWQTYDEWEAQEIERIKKESNQ